MFSKGIVGKPSLRAPLCAFLRGPLCYRIHLPFDSPYPRYLGDGFFNAELHRGMHTKVHRENTAWRDNRAVGKLF